MAKGKKSLLETTDLPIIETDIEEGLIPYFLIEDEWGINCDERNEILVRKRIASRTIKDENDVENHIEQYVVWEAETYSNTFTHTIECYINKKDKGEKSKLIKSKDYKDLISIQNEIKSNISKALDFNGINKEFLSITSILDERAEIEEELKLLREAKKQIEIETDKLLQLIKEKRSIIISNTEQKKHRIKEENGDA